MPEYQKSDDAIARLNAEQFRITQQNGTEPPAQASTCITGIRGFM